MSWIPPRRRDGRGDASIRPQSLVGSRRLVDRRTLVDKVWDAHVVGERLSDDTPDRLVVDRILLHEQQISSVGRSHGEGTHIAAPGRVVACADQQGPTTPSTGEPRAGAQLLAAIDRLEQTSTRLGLPLFGPGDPRGGIVNVVAAEQGMVLPGSLIVGADAHVATHGAFGALALVISDGEVADVLRTGEVERVRPRVVRATIIGSLADGAGAKDLALWLLGRLGGGFTGNVVLELAGPAVHALSVEGRMTLTNMAVECGATAVVTPPDTTVEDYLEGRPFVPVGEVFERACDEWRELASDNGADYDADVVAFGGTIEPQATWGTDVDQVAPLDGVVPHPGGADPTRLRRHEEALADQDLEAGQPMSDISVDQVFVGSCANARIEDLRSAAEVARGGRAQVPTWVVPGSWPVKRQAETEGLHRVFLDAGFEWRDPGCSLCIGANGDAVRPGARLASTANRPARGVVGPAARVHILGPASAAATALAGHLAAPS